MPHVSPPLRDMGTTAACISKTRASLHPQSCEAAKDYSPRRKPWVCEKKPSQPRRGVRRWSRSTGMLDLNKLIPRNSGWLLQVARAINDQGQILDLGMLNGQNEAFR